MGWFSRPIVQLGTHRTWHRQTLHKLTLDPDSTQLHSHCTLGNIKQGWSFYPFIVSAWAGFHLPISMCMQQMVQGKITFTNNQNKPTGCSDKFKASWKNNTRHIHQNLASPKPASYLTRHNPSGIQVTGRVELKSNKAHVATPKQRHPSARAIKTLWGPDVISHFHTSKSFLNSWCKYLQNEDGDKQLCRKCICNCNFQVT